MLSTQIPLNTSLLWALCCLGSFKHTGCEFPRPACTLLHPHEAGATTVTLLGFPNAPMLPAERQSVGVMEILQTQTIPAYAELYTLPS